MITPLLGTWLQILGWVLVGSVVALAWVLAGLILGDSPRTKSSRWTRAAISTGPALLVQFLLAIAIRTIAAFSVAGGPYAWLDAAVGTSLAKHVAPSDLLLILALINSLSVSSLWLVFSIRQRVSENQEAFKVPAANPLALAFSAVAILFLVLINEPLAILGKSAVLLDFLALLPVACFTAAIWTRSEQEIFLSTAPLPEQLPAPAQLDIAALWRQIGAIAPDAQPLLSLPGRSAIPIENVTADLWRCIGAPGPPPASLDEIQTEPLLLQGWIVGDLPEPSEKFFLAALILRSVYIDGTTCLIVSDDVTTDASGNARSSLRDLVEDGMRAAGLWSCGPLVVGDRELREAIAGRRMPAAAFLNVSELSAQGIRTLGRTEAEHGALWARQVGLVVAARFDRGSPLRVTHRVLTLRRLGLALHAAGARWSVMATGFGGAGTRTLFEQIFPGIPVRELPFAPRASAPIQVWPAAASFVSNSNSPWVRRAAEPLVRAGLSMSVSDPLGSFDLNALEVEVGKVTLDRDVVLDGDASASQLSEAWFLATLRALPNRIPLASEGTHHTLWGLSQSPVMRFLSRPGTLDWLARQANPPALRPLIGYQNKLLARAHLHAALREGEQDLVSLIGIFGRSAVDQVIGADFVPERFALRTVPSQSGVVRVPLAPAMAGEVRNPLKTTVTDDVIQIVDRNGGKILCEADRVTVEAHYYPGRVFAIGPRRYEIPMHAYDAKRGQIHAELVDASKSLTKPILDVQIAQPELVEAPHQVTVGRLIFGLATYEATVVEAISGVRQADGRAMNYAPLSSQYRTRIRAILFPGSIEPKALKHLAASFENTLMAHVLATDEELVVVPLPPAFCPPESWGIGVVDRFVQGMGVANALDGPLVEEVLVWVRAILSACSCPQGCVACTPPEISQGQGDKEGVLAVLGT